MNLMERDVSFVLWRGGTSTCSNNSDNFSKYFCLLQETLMKLHGIVACPSCLHNTDESGLPLDSKPPRVVVPRGTNKVHCCPPRNKEQITVGMWQHFLYCYSAKGHLKARSLILNGLKEKFQEHCMECPTKAGRIWNCLVTGRQISLFQNSSTSSHVTTGWTLLTL